jgi:dTDP-glucose 4,6-dehydratase
MRIVVSLKLAVIGSNSFSGASFVDYALNQGADVIGVSRSAEPNAAHLPYRWSGKDRAFQFFPYDLNKHLDRLVALIEKEQPAYVVNFAAQSMVGESWKHPEHWFATNVVSTVRLHDKLRRFDFIKKYVHVTTPEVYGNTNGFVRENAPFNPSTPYAVSRAAADMSLQTFFQTYRFPVVFTRSANVYGPGQQLYRIIPRTILFIRLGKKISLHGGGHSSRSFVHIKDVSDATWRVMKNAPPGEAYHISTNEIMTIRQLVERICAKMGASFDSAVEVVGDRPGKDAAYMLDSTKIRHAFGWSDRLGLEEGLDDCIQWVDRNIEALRHQNFDYVHKA